MRRAVALVACVALCGCAFAQKHPAVTIGAVAGTLTFGLCSLNVDDTGKCAIVGAAAGVGLGGITGLVMLFANTNAEETDPDLDETDPRYQSVTPPPPGLPPELMVDAGVAMPVVVDAGIPADAAP
jgi:hypothetical protein